MQQMAKNQKPASKWVKIGVASRQYSALRLEILIGPARGSYYISAADLAYLTTDTIKVYRVKTVHGEPVPVVAGFAAPSKNRTMVTVQIIGQHARAMMPAQQLAQHVASTANQPTTITAPSEEVYPDLSGMAGPVGRPSQAVTA